MARITKFRACLLMVLVVLILGLYGLKLYSMQVTAAEENGNNSTTYQMYYRVRAARGEILDTNGNVLVTNRASYDIYLNHYVLFKLEDTNAALLELVELCRELGVEYTDHFPMTQEAPFTYTYDQQSSTWKGYFQQFLVKRGNIDSDISATLLLQQLRTSYDIPEDWSDRDARAVIGIRYELTLRTIVTSLSSYVLAEDVEAEARDALLGLNLAGLTVETSSVREYNTQYAAHILGYIGAMSSDQWAYYKTLEGYDMDALVGQTGLEEAFEEYLHGVDGVRIDTVTVDGTVIDSYYVTEPQAGSNVEISIDLLLQSTAEDALAEVMEARRETGLDAQGAAVVAIDVKTGQVLVCGSYPTYDLSTVLTDWEDLATADYNPMWNRALRSVYSPGSTFKVAMSIAGANAGVITSTTQINDTGIYIKYSGYSPKCLYYTKHGVGHGWLTAAQALKVSCNYYFYWLADNMDIWDIDSTAAALGLGEYTGVELYEEQGYRANPTSKALLGAAGDTSWYPADQLMAGIGHSTNYFTPIQLAVYASTLANQGTRYKATFLSRVLSSDYRSLLYESTVEILGKLDICDEALEIYMTGMQMVAQEYGGTAYSTFKNYPVKVAAKTGTAQVTNGSDNGAFICFAPADDPQIAIAVYGEGVNGGSYLAPVAKAILDAYFGYDSGDVDSYENQLS